MYYYWFRANGFYLSVCAQTS